jgi:hypothetical protein
MGGSAAGEAGDTSNQQEHKQYCPGQLFHFVTFLFELMTLFDTCGRASQSSEEGEYDHDNK